jgi:hypothetical protein
MQRSLGALVPPHVDTTAHRLNHHLFVNLRQRRFLFGSEFTHWVSIQYRLNAMPVLGCSLI